MTAVPGAAAAAAPGVIELVVDGRSIEGTVIPLPEPGTPLVRVEVRLA
jgi:hypothetical protein